MFHSSQKSFEKSLRSSAATTSTATYQVPITTPLKTEIHKGCTGKAHACGTIKSTNTILVNKSASPSSPLTAVAVKVKAKCENKPPTRKNSLSSETVSDSGSESWNSSGKDTSVLSSNNGPVTLPKQPLKRTKSVNYGSSSVMSNGNARRRTSDSVISADVTDNCKPNVVVKLQRGRLLSDGDGKQQTPTTTTDSAAVDSSRLKRSASFRSKNIPPLIPPPKPKPVAVSSSSSSAVIKQNGNFNSSGRLRSSFRGLKNQNQAVNWNAIYESSFSTKFGGGNFRTLDKNLLASKVIKKFNGRDFD